MILKSIFFISLMWTIGCGLDNRSYLNQSNTDTAGSIDTPQTYREWKAKINGDCSYWTNKTKEEKNAYVNVVLKEYPAYEDTLSLQATYIPTIEPIQKYSEEHKIKVLDLASNVCLLSISHLDQWAQRINGIKTITLEIKSDMQRCPEGFSGQILDYATMFICKKS